VFFRAVELWPSRVALGVWEPTVIAAGAPDRTRMHQSTTRSSSACWFRWRAIFRDAGGGVILALVWTVQRRGSSSSKRATMLIAWAVRGDADRKSSRGRAISSTCTSISYSGVSSVVGSMVGGDRRKVCMAAPTVELGERGICDGVSDAARVSSQRGRPKARRLHLLDWITSKAINDAHRPPAWALAVFARRVRRFRRSAERSDIVAGAGEVPRSAPEPGGLEGRGAVQSAFAMVK